MGDDIHAAFLGDRRIEVHGMQPHELPVCLRASTCNKSQNGVSGHQVHAKFCCANLDVSMRAFCFVAIPQVGISG